jgi:hypothetical protein
MPTNRGWAGAAGLRNVHGLTFASNERGLLDPRPTSGRSLPIAFRNAARNAFGMGSG